MSSTHSYTPRLSAAVNKAAPLVSFWGKQDSAFVILPSVFTVLFSKTTKSIDLNNINLRPADISMFHSVFRVFGGGKFLLITNVITYL